MAPCATGCRCSVVLSALLVVSLGATALAQGPTYGFGRPAGAGEVRTWDAIIGPKGEDLPPGAGTAKQGVTVWMNRGCAGCHGPTGAEGPAPSLVGGEYTLTAAHPPLSQWPYASGIWDFINRAMPINTPGYLTPDEVYALTALLLYRNGIIKEDETMNAQTLPKVQMPNREFGPPPEWKPGGKRPFDITP